MTATADNKTKLVSTLISSCYTAQNGYRLAANAVEDDALKRLFEIYAQQRTRFAAELREYLPLEESDSNPGQEAEAKIEENSEPRQESIRKCLELDARNLELYKEALARRALPSRAQFLISSQLALLQRVHDRVSLMLNERHGTGMRFEAQRISA